MYESPPAASGSTAVGTVEEAEAQAFFPVRRPAGRDPATDTTIGDRGPHFGGRDGVWAGSVYHGVALRFDSKSLCSDRFKRENATCGTFPQENVAVY